MRKRDTGTEQQIKEAARRIFFVKGKLHATTQDIADTAGISRTSLHCYYSSREALMTAVAAEAMREIDAPLYALVASSIPFRDKLEKIIELFLLINISHPYLKAYLVAEGAKDNIEIIEITEAAFPVIKSFLREVEKEMKAGRIMKMRPVQFVKSLFALITYPLVVKSSRKKLLAISDEQHNRIMIQERKKLIVDILVR